MRVCAPNLLGRRWPFSLDRPGREPKEASQHAPEPRTLDAGAFLLEVRDQRCYRVPAGRRERWPTLHQKLIQRWQRRLAGLSALANHMQRVIPVFVASDVTKRGADEFASAQTDRIAEIEQKAKALCSRRATAI